MLFKELVKQHGVDLVVTDRFGLPLWIASDQISTYLGYLLSDQAKRSRLGRTIFFVVAEAHRLEGKEHVAGFVHRLDVMFIPARRYVPATKSAAASDGNVIGVCINNGLHVAIDVADKAAVVHVRARRADTDDVVGCGNAAAGSMNQGDVAATSAAKERPKADGRVDRYNSVLQFLVCSLRAIHGLTVPVSSGKRSDASATFTTTA
jgi:hypothetical protein